MMIYCIDVIDKPRTTPCGTRFNFIFFIFSSRKGENKKKRTKKDPTNYVHPIHTRCAQDKFMTRTNYVTINKTRDPPIYHCRDGDVGGPSHITRIMYQKLADQTTVIVLFCFSFPLQFRAEGYFPLVRINYTLYTHAHIHTCKAYLVTSSFTV